MRLATRRLPFGLLWLLVPIAQHTVAAPSDHGIEPFRIELQPGLVLTNATIDLSLSKGTDLVDVEVRSNQPVDVFILPEAEYRYFMSGERHEYWFPSMGAALSVYHHTERVALPGGEIYYLVVDNSILPKGGAAASASAAIEAWAITLERPGKGAGFNDFAAALLQRHSAYELPWGAGMGISSILLLALVLMLALEAYAWRRPARAWLPVLALAGTACVAGLLLAAVEGDAPGFAWFLVPAFLAGVWMARFVPARLLGSACALSLGFWAAFLGTQVMPALYLHDHWKEAFYYGGTLSVMGNEGLDAAFLRAPLAALGGYWVGRWGVLGPRLRLRADWQGPPNARHLHVRVRNWGLGTARDLRFFAWHLGPGGQETRVMDMAAGRRLRPGRFVELVLEDPVAHAPERGSVLMGVRSGNAPADVLRVRVG